jgi:alpha-1,2-mannosyltransferase
MTFLRDATWLGAPRARAYAAMLAIFMGLGLLYGWVSLWLGHHPWTKPDGSGLPGATDFLSFWTAGRFVWHGHAADAFDLTALRLAEDRTAVMEPNAVLAFFYPPPFLLLCLPFALLPYLAGFAAFVGAQTATLVLLLRRILPEDWGYLPVLAFPGLLLNAATGQNGFVSASCFAAALLLLESWPAAAGAILGLLVVKPHLALAVPVALFCARRWSALFACAASAAAFAALSWAVLGTAAWAGFLHAAPDIRAALELHEEDWGKLQSIFTTARILGAPLAAAYAVQAALALGVLVALATACARRPGAGPETALLATAALLCTPHVLDYDLAVAGVPLAWLARDADRTGWRPWEKTSAGLVYLWPMLGRVLTQSYHLALGPLLLLGLFVLLRRRIMEPA